MKKTDVVEMNASKKRQLLTMSVDNWIAVTDCPVQRDTRRHAEKARKKHLKTRSRTQSLVTAARLNGQLIKVDGHTRSFCWQNNWLARPDDDQVDVIVYPCSNMGAVIQLYQEFDSQAQGKDSKDKTVSAFKECKFEAKSNLLNNGSLTYALQMAMQQNSSNFSLRKTTSEWLPVLELIDEADFTRRRFPGAIFAALLITTRIYGEAALVFWLDYSEDNGERRKGECDGVQALSELLLKRSKEDKVGGRNCSIIILGCALYCFENWKKGKWLKQSPRQLDHGQYLKSHPYPAWEDWS